MTFNELKTHAMWRVIQGITHGHSLDSVMHEVLLMCLNWREEEVKKTAKKKRGAA